jgi:beta-1,2-mannobiose phosphorylase / 1,2-beta-oligomannan phosphorylase
LALEHTNTADPRKFELQGYGWKVMALTSLAWLLPVELSPDGPRAVDIHYGKAIAPQGTWQCYGLEDARISRVEGRWLMTTCSVSPERHSTTLYSSDNALDWTFEGIVLDHQNKDMLIFEGLVRGQYWAQTRPLGALFFAYPPGSPWHAGPSINHATSPDALHWKPHIEPAIRPHAGTAATARIGGGTPPVLTEVAGKRGWLTLWHGVEPKQIVGIYRTYWSLLDPEEPWKVLATTSSLRSIAPASAWQCGRTRWSMRRSSGSGLPTSGDGTRTPASPICCASFPCGSKGRAWERSRITYCR